MDKLEAEGILYIDTYCVDNALARIADPLFVGQVSLSHGDVGRLRQNSTAVTPTLPASDFIDPFILKCLATGKN